MTQAQPAKPAFDFLNLKAQFASIREEIMAAVTRVMESQQFILGAEVASFEEEVAAMLGAKHAVGCASGTDALTLSMTGAGIGPGDEVITTPFSFIATAGSIAQVGARPVFVDIDPVTFNIDPSKVEAAITTKTRAIMPVHLFGLPADLAPILALAKSKQLTVIEDAAQAIGSRYDTRFIGTFGDFGCFSFFPSKNLGGAGDGGLITTNDSGLADRLRMIRVHGSSKKYFHDVQGVNSRLDALQAAVLRVKLRHLPKWEAGRRDRAERYRQLFEARGLNRSLAWPPEPLAKFHHVYNQFTIRAQRRDELKESLRLSGIPSEIYYPLCLHLQKAFAHMGCKPGQFPEAEKASREVLSLPVFPELSDAQQNMVVDAIKSFYTTSA
ncbi:MAG TPA: DegT/DnrJ/EryC1/StrS family aminotransferase [Candidatus Limnocylindrales bacterium]|nr:DegT/DnrJ/EryC1/StrS family aminotransferase [Candidatus Limnocylindrales bacterium]